MAELLTLDANVLVYSQDLRDPRKHAIANEVIKGLRRTNALLTTIVLGEFFNVTARKYLPMIEARRCLEDFATVVPVVTYSPWHLLIGAGEASTRRFSFWDAVILACAEDAGCTVCLSEDMSDGAQLGKLVVRNPFGPRGLTDDIRALLQP